MTAPVVLPFPDGRDWHWRWVQFPGERSVTLHRVARFGGIDRDIEVEITDVRTVCGRAIPKTRMPGLISRLGAPRCRICCARMLNVPPGKGNPYNEGIRDERLMPGARP